MTRIVSIGECMIEMAPMDAAASYHMGFAGDTMNTAWYLRRLLPERDRVDYVTAVGTDSASDQMVQFLHDAGLGTGHIARRADRTVGLYMIQLQDGERSFSYWRGQSAARALASDTDTLTRALAGADMAYFSGITVAILPPEDRRRLLAVLAEFRASGGMVMFDPNLRPKLWSTPEEMTEAIMQAAGVSSTVLPSHEDEAAWFGDADLSATAARYANAGAQTVLVKNGGGPMLAMVAGEVTLHDPDPVAQIVDTTAAGDSFNAGYLAAVLQGQSTAQAVRAGARLAGKVIQARGALVDPGA